MNSSYSVIGFTLASDWLRDWSEFSEPITKRRRAKKKKEATMDNFGHTIENYSIINIMIIILFKSLFSALRVVGRESQANVVMIYISLLTRSHKKRGKTRATKSWLALVLHLIWKIGASFLDQSLSKTMQKQNNPGLHSALNWKML